MKNTIFIDTSKHLTLAQYIRIAEQILSLIADFAEEVNEVFETLSVADLSVLLHRITTHMSGEFEIQPTPSRYCLVVYKSAVLNEAGLDDASVVPDFSDPLNQEQNTLWMSEKVLTAFINRQLYGVAFELYFSLGVLMTRDDAFAVSQQISFARILEIYDVLRADFCLTYPTTLMRALADLQDAGLLQWKAKSRTFELLHITPYDPQKKA